MKTRTQESSGVVGRVTPCAPVFADNHHEKTARRGLTRPTFVTIVLLMLGLATSLHAQSYSIDWFTIDGGGGTSTGGPLSGTNYSVTGTIGQPDASAAMSGGNFSLTGGFWSLIAVVQTTGLPNLCIAHSGNTVVVSWPDMANCTLQTNNNLANAPGWNAYGGTVNAANGTNSVTITPPTGNLFFRLKK